MCPQSVWSVRLSWGQVECWPVRSLIWGKLSIKIYIFMHNITVNCKHHHSQQFYASSVQECEWDSFTGFISVNFAAWFDGRIWIQEVDDGVRVLGHVYQRLVSVVIYAFNFAHVACEVKCLNNNAVWGCFSVISDKVAT